MLIRHRHATTPREAEVTPRQLVADRRSVISGALAAAGVVAAPAVFAASPFEALPKTGLPGETPTARKDAISYNNFYEFSTDKAEPARLAAGFRARPWTLEVGGEAMHPTVFDLDELLRFPLEERICRLRCVEAWSMVIPWIGFPLAELLKRVEPTSHARFVTFETLLDPRQMPGQNSRLLDWPYVEGLRLDEALHPLTLMAVGMYGELLPNQNGAPLRLAVPWKYGFKSIKSIARINLVREQPTPIWSRLSAHEYGFYANVNPAVDHPRWSQRRERRIGEFLKRDTLPFNGYAEDVAHLYAGMDLGVNY